MVLALEGIFLNNTGCDLSIISWCFPSLFTRYI